MTYLCTEYGLSSDVVENCTCEMLRWYYSSGQFHETIGGWQYIYTFEDDLIRAYNVDGNLVSFAMAKWDFTPPCKSKFCGIRWWENDYAIAITFKQQLEGEILLTNK